MKTQLIDLLEGYNYWGSQPIQPGYPRPAYVQQLLDLMGNTLVKVILGQRRAGKSHLLRALIAELIKTGKIKPHQTLYLNLELHDFSFIKSADDLMAIVKEYRKHINPNDKAYIILDEIQEIREWEKIVNSLAQNHRELAEVFITGSNANLLSGELATYLGGRYVTMTVYPFSYQEYLRVVNKERNKQSLLLYLQEGGLPELFSLQTKESQFNYIQSLLDSIVLRDIVQRNQIRDVALLEKIIHFSTDSVGSLVSIPSIMKTLSQQKYKTNPETLGNYLHYCENAYFLHECPRYDVRGKQILTGEKKYYLNDLAFNRVTQSGFELRLHRFLKNAVYLTLLRRGYKVYVGRIDQKEIDFIAEGQNEKQYVQVAYLLPDESVIRREFGNLLLIPDNYPKYVISLDEAFTGNIEGIIHLPAWEFIE